MFKLTVPLILASAYFLFMPPYYQRLTVVRKPSNETQSEYTMESILFSENIVQGFIVAPNSTDSRSYLENTLENSNNILLISTSDCNIQTTLSKAGQAGYSAVLLYDDDQSYLQIDITTLPRVEMEKIRNGLKYIGKIGIEDAVHIKEHYVYPAELRFQGFLNPPQMAVDKGLKFVALYNSKFFPLFLLYGLAISIYYWIKKKVKFNNLEIEPTESPQRQISDDESMESTDTEDPTETDEDSDIEFSNDFCPICLESLEETDEGTLILPCTHYYHADCINSWFRKDIKRRCPTCRYEVTCDDPNFEYLADYEIEDFGPISVNIADMLEQMDLQPLHLGLPPLPERIPAYCPINRRRLRRADD